MKDLQKLFTALVLSKHNIRILHWKAIGVEFDAVHSVMDEYAKCFDKLIDEVGEIMVEMKIDPLCIHELMELAKEDSDNEYLCIDPARDYPAKEAFSHINTMFTLLCKLYNEICDEDDIPENVISKLQEHQRWISLELNYKNARRMCLTE